MLIGLAAKNAILIVEFAKRRREDGLDIVEAAMRPRACGCGRSSMTAFAFILGVVPLMFATGAGAASRQSIGTTVFGGMLAATILTLAFVPVFYALIEQLRESRLGPPAAARSLSKATPNRRNEIGVQHHANLENSSAVLLPSAAIAIAVVVRSARRRADLAVPPERRPIPQRLRCQCPLTNIVKKTIPISLDYSARTESIRNVALRPKVSGYHPAAARRGRNRRQEGDLLYTIDPRDFRRRWIRQRRRRRDISRRSTMRAPISIAGRSLAQSGYLAKDTFDQRSSAARQAEADFGDGPRPPSEQPSSISATRRSAHRSPGRLGRNQASVGTLISISRRGAEHLGAARSDLRHVQSEREPILP